MTIEERLSPEEVGPVLVTTPLGEAMLAAIGRENAAWRVLRRGGLVRVLVKGRCSLRRELVEEEWGQRVTFPGDLERVMPSFKGHLLIDADQAVWESDHAR